MDALLRRDRAVALGGILGISALAWTYTAHLAGGMASPQPSLAMPQMEGAWGPADLLLAFTMWVVMMVAMMLPSAAPVILLVASLNRRRLERGGPAVPTAIFLLGYVLIWTGYAALAALAQLGLHNAALLSPVTDRSTPLLGGALLLAAGVYQWTPLKRMCLAHCRSPLHFLSTQWREGTAGALVMGLKHGAFCVGCCWLLMSLLFVAGVMNLLWVAVIAGLVLIEKVAPAGGWMGRVAGLVLVGWAMWILASA